MDIKWVIGTIIGVVMLFFTGMYALDTRRLVNHEISQNEIKGDCAAFSFLDGGEDILVLPANSNDDSAKRFADFITLHSRLTFVSYQLNFRGKSNFTRSAVIYEGEENRSKAEQIAAILPGDSYVASFSERPAWSNPEGRDFFIALGKPYLISEKAFMASCD